VTPMTDEVVRADPVVRRRALALLLGAAVAGAAAIQWGLPWLELARLRQPGMQRTICLTFLGVIVALALAVIGSGRRIAGLGRRTVALQEFPPPGVKLLHDVRRMTGARAIYLGRGYVIIGWTLVVLALVLLGLGSYALVVLWPR
jgi:hypothetical protein